MKKLLALALALIIVACGDYSSAPTPVHTPTPTPTSVRSSTPTPTAVRSSTPTPRPVRSSTPTPETTSYSVTEGCLAAALLLTSFDGSIDMDLNAVPVYMEAMVTTDEISLNLSGETVVDLMLSFPDAPTPENLLEIIDAFGVYAETCDDLVPR